MCMKYTALFIFIVICTLFLTFCNKEEGAYYESFYDIDLSDGNDTFTFRASPQSDKPYRVMLVLFPKTEHDRRLIFDYLLYDHSTEPFGEMKKIYTHTTIRDSSGEIIYENYSNIIVVSHNRERFNCYLMERAINLDKGKGYIIEVEFKNLHQYPLSHVKSKLAFGLGGYYEGSLFH